MTPVTIQTVNSETINVIKNDYDIDTGSLNNAIENLISNYDPEDNCFWLEDGSKLTIGRIYDLRITYEPPYLEYVDNQPSHEVPGTSYFTFNKVKI